MLHRRNGGHETCEPDPRVRAPVVRFDNCLRFSPRAFSLALLFSVTLVPLTHFSVTLDDSVRQEV